MTRLAAADLEAILGFLADVSRLDFEEPYPLEVVNRARALIPCDDAMYQDADVGTKRFEAVVADGDDDPEADALYWTVGPCPISEYRTRTGELVAVRMSDVVSERQYHELPIFREYFHPGGVDHMIDLGLPASGQRQRSFLFLRETGAHDFTDRDRAVLEMLRPHLLGIEARAALRRRLSEVTAAEEGDGRSDPYSHLTVREREIVRLVAQGKTNAQIAGELWVAPSTVKKHLENVYEKLGVSRRTAAATMLQPLQ
jgi:DNA-binding CsgD family transcriptional regulator